MRRFLLCLFCAGVSTWQYLVDSLATCNDCFETTAKIAAGSFDAPFVYRQLTPQILMALGNTVQAHTAFQFLMLLAFFWLLWRWVERWDSSGLVAVALATVALVLMWPTFYFSSYTTTEWVLWLIALNLLTPRSWSLLRPTAK